MGNLGSTKLFYSARPRLEVEGREEEALAEGLLGLAVEESIEGLFSCEVTLGNWGGAAGGVDFLYFDRQLLDFGHRFAVDMGEGDSAARIFEGRITGIEGRYPEQRPPEVLLLAEDRFQDLRMVRRSRSFEDVTDRDVVEEIAQQHGLQSDVDIDGPTHALLAQVNQSDLAFLRERMRAVDAELWVEGDTLHAQARRRRQTAEVDLTYGQGLHEFSVVADLAMQRTSLAVAGWDVEAKEGIEHEVDASALGAELDGGAAGGALLEEVFGERKEKVVHLVPLSREEAETLADAGFRRMARRFVAGRGVAEGDGRLRAGTHVRLRGLGEMFDGSYYVTRAQHTFDARGYRTHLRVERPGLGGGA